MRKRIFLGTTLTMAMSAALAAMVSCTDPVLDDAIAALGPEVAAPGPEHRPGQPCVLCHSESGTDPNHVFSVAGTIYETSTGAQGAAGVEVRLRAADGSERITSTNPAGNFYVAKDAWDPAFPLHVHIYRPGDAVQRMNTMIGREGSCASCHFDAPNTSFLPDARPSDYQPFVAVGRVYLKLGAP